MSTSGPLRQRSLSNKARVRTQALPNLQTPDVVDSLPFEPCAATASILLYAHKSTVLCLHYDTLAIDRRFTNHTADIVFIAVDNVSETGAGRLVVTYDARQTAIVWDILTGEQISRFASYEPLRVAAWMRNGNISFGNGKGEVILFEPSTSEHVSARTIFDPITAIAPASDCKTYAIGYNNGSILLAALQPSFTILHTLTTSRAPSPIAHLTWHASSSKQKSDMLATQTANGDLRVWSISKPPTAENPRVIRVLKRDEKFAAGRTWISWSRNGRIIQYAESETWAWDVRTKNVTYEPLPLVEGIRGITGHGPSGTLFTFASDHTVQQYDVELGQVVRNVRHLPAGVPATPPEEAKPVAWTTSESEEDAPSPFPQSRPAPATSDGVLSERPPTYSPVSHRSGRKSVSTRAPKPHNAARDINSPGVRTENTGTHFSIGSQLKSTSRRVVEPPPLPREERKRSHGGPGADTSSEETSDYDLFPYTRARLSDVPYRPPRSTDETRMTPDDLRRQMLSVIFGWENDIHELVRDERERHSPGSEISIYLSRWLSEDSKTLADTVRSTEFVDNSEWKLLALSVVENHASSKKLVQVFVEKLLGRGDIHAAATLLLVAGDYSDAIEVYVSRNLFMESVLLTCTASPQDWQRISHLVRKWGEHAVENAQQQLAIRCFSCAGIEPTDPWTSPSAQKAADAMDDATVQTQDESTYHRVLQSDVYQKAMERRRNRDAPTPVAMPAPPAPLKNSGAQGPRVTPQTSALKLITSFEKPSSQFKFPGLRSDDRTPTYGTAITPIAESAIDRSALSPGGAGSYRTNNMRSISAALTPRNAAQSPHPLRQRLPSIGETPVGDEPSAFLASPGPNSLPTPADSLSDEKDQARQTSREGDPRQKSQSLLMLSSARYEPSVSAVQETPQTAIAPSTAISYSVQRRLSGVRSPVEDPREADQPRNGSRNRKPDGLHIHTASVAEPQYHQLTTRQISTAHPVSRFEDSSEVTSPPSTANTYQSAKSASVSGQSHGQSVANPAPVQHHGRPRGHSGSSRLSKDESSDRRAHRHPQTKLDDLRGPEMRRTASTPKRSPSSPIPMSPEDVRFYSASLENFEALQMSAAPAERATTPGTNARTSRRRASSIKDGKPGQRSRSRQLEGGNLPTGPADSRPSSPEPTSAVPGSRGRSSSRKTSSGQRSPTSPVPAAGGEDDRGGADVDPALRLVSADRQRGQRSASRRPARDSSAKRDQSADPKRQRVRSRSRAAEEQEAELGAHDGEVVRVDQGRRRRQRDSSHHHPQRSEAVYGPGDSRRKAASALALSPNPEPQSATGSTSGTDRRKKQLAAAELEARRLSLARRPSVPNIPLPGQARQNRSASVGLTPPLPEPPSARPHADNILTSARYGGTGGGSEPVSRNITPRAMHRVDGREGLELLPASAYTSPVPRSNSQQDYFAPPAAETVSDLPKHPAFDARIASSRLTSRTGEEQTGPRARNTSGDRARFSPFNSMSPPVKASPFPNNGGMAYPPILPELQHLASPPPPPPPPTPPKPSAHRLRIDTDYVAASQAPLPASALGSTDSPASANPNGHRRGRSGNFNESSQLISRIRSFTGRVRSTSRGRDNLSRSPSQRQQAGFAVTTPPYETVIQGSSPPMQPQAFANMNMV